MTPTAFLLKTGQEAVINVKFIPSEVRKYSARCFFKLPYYIRNKNEMIIETCSSRLSNVSAIRHRIRMVMVLFTGHLFNCSKRLILKFTLPQVEKYSTSFSLVSDNCTERIFTVQGESETCHVEVIAVSGHQAVDYDIRFVAPPPPPTSL